MAREPNQHVSLRTALMRDIQSKRQRRCNRHGSAQMLGDIVALGGPEGHSMKRFYILLPFIALSIRIAVAEEASARSSQAPPLPSWTGLYAGINAGGLWNGLSASTSPDWSRLTVASDMSYPRAFSALPPMNFGWSNKSGFAGGGQIGYNWQVTHRIVVGVETDFQGVAGGSDAWSSDWAGASARHSPNSVGSVRGRAGYLVTPNLQVYGTGGMAYGAGN